MKNDKIYKYLKFILPIWGLICALICALAFKYSFDREIGYFRSSPPTYIFVATLVIAIILPIVAAINSTDESTKGNRRAMATVLALAFAFYTVSLVLTNRPALLSASLYLILISSSAISTLHFLIVAFVPTASENLTVITGLAPMLTAILSACVSYLDHAQPLNSPYKLLFEFALVAFALYYLTELREYTDAPKNKLLIAFSGISLTLSLCAGVSKMFEIIYLSAPTINNIASAILFAALASCAATKLLES